MTAAISNVQATAASDATTKAAAAQSAAIAQAANLYQPKFGTAGWADVTLSRGAGTIFHNTGTPRFVLIYHGSGGVTFTSSSASDLSGSVVIGPDVSANGATQTVSGSFVVPPNYYYRIDGTVLNWYEYAL